MRAQSHITVIENKEGGYNIMKTLRKIGLAGLASAAFLALTPSLTVAATRKIAPINQALWCIGSVINSLQPSSTLEALLPGISGAAKLRRLNRRRFGLAITSRALDTSGATLAQLITPTKLQTSPSRLAVGGAETSPSRLAVGGAETSPSRLAAGGAETSPSRLAAGGAETSPSRLAVGGAETSPSRLAVGGAETSPSRLAAGGAETSPSRLAAGGAETFLSNFRIVLT